MSITAMRKALEAMLPVSAYGRIGSKDVEQAALQSAITALRTAIAEAEACEQEPVAWGSADGYWVQASDLQIRPDKKKFTEPFYAAPPQAQERKPLTDEQITEVWRELRAQKEDWSDLDFARAIEAYIKEQP